MLRNLKAEMARNEITAKDIHKVIGKSEKTARAKIEGETPLSLPEAFAIRDQLFPGLSLEYLFERASQPSGPVRG